MTRKDYDTLSDLLVELSFKNLMMPLDQVKVANILLSYQCTLNAAFDLAEELRALKEKIEKT